MAAFALTEKAGENFDSIRRQLSAMFHVILSGTHAPIEVRLQIIRQLWESHVESKQLLATELINAALEAWHFQPQHNPISGSRSRDYGAWPNQDELNYWFTQVVEQCMKMIADETSFKAELKNILASNLRGIWTKARLFDLVESVCERMTSDGFWDEGWFGILSIARFDLEEEELQVRRHLLRLEESLKPKNMYEQIVAYFLSDARGMDISYAILKEDEDDNGFKKRLLHYEALGAELMKDTETFDKLYSKLLLTNNFDITHFGREMYYGSLDREKFWNTLLDQYLLLPAKKRQFFVLKGWISGAHREGEKFSDQILKQVVASPEAIHLLLPLQSAIPTSQNGLRFLQKALADIEVQSEDFESLSYSQINSDLSPELLTDFIRNLLNRPNGRNAAFELLYYKCHVVKSESVNDMTEELIVMGRQLLLDLDLDKELKSNDNYKIGTVIEICFEGEAAFNSANEFCLKLMRLVRSTYLHPSHVDRILRKLVNVHPVCILNTLLEKGISNEYVRWLDFHRDYDKYDAYLSTLSNDLLLSWCQDVSVP